uniref:Signal sequence receptor subunit alpha n=1 Tax=Timspurckia oligopyrenoides TaxID=708627 RepID=A0A7S1EQE6_9RHOD|mmetsp:Transcript_12706/g.22865  ORF Transcript_12706/g.22865 Transcript_12706/m.22865 type:complete len:322 (+) Transcript_12706:58-1023(+)|eukprot:CAMPEP_0182442098 /NCGR_PEP_ID=MMETSP1172-20130603/1060_1 /TAXON_ID=708627 /ORGANISM="Timspurckia oligopyrenoides, Strain CCMP3278" /LENGTH=321 /DNA_ID=CAMNT_0024636795 /DNA_START=51 /DNA_END=1019 /DNA_ORIENTATION=-
MAMNVISCSNTRSSRSLVFKLCLFLTLFLTLIALKSVSGEVEDEGLDIMEEMEAEIYADTLSETQEHLSAVEEEAKSSGKALDPQHPLTNMPPPAEGVEAGGIFKSGKNDGFVLGKEIDVLGVISYSKNEFDTNLGMMHVWGVLGSLNDVNEFGKYVQNFTYSVVNRSLMPGEESSFEYKVIPYERLEAKEYRMCLSVFYEEVTATGTSKQAPNGGPLLHASTVLNVTVRLNESESGIIDNRVFYGLLLTGIALAIGVGLSVNLIKSWMKKRKGKKSTKSVEMGTKDVADNEWLQTHLSMKESSNRVKRAASIIEEKQHAS